MVKKFDLYNTPPEENEEETLEEEAPMRSQFLSEANDDAQLEYTREQPLIETELEDDSQPPPPPPPTAQERYANVLKQASEAGPRASDYRAIALGKLSSALGAGMGGYMESMAGTMFHKPNFSWMDEGRDEVGKLGEYNIKAKEAEKKRLVDEAAGIRQEALLPGEMAAQEAKSREVQARLESLKPASQEELDDYENLTGTKLPAGTTKGALAKFLAKALTPMSEYEKRRTEQAEVRAELTKTGQEQGQERAEKKRSDEKLKLFDKLTTSAMQTYKKDVKKNEEDVALILKVQQMLNSKDWPGLNAVPARFAKLIGGDSGVLTDKDIERYQYSPEIKAKLKDQINRAFTGEPDQETIDAYKRVVSDALKKTREEMGRKQKEAGTRLKNNRMFQALEGRDEEIVSQVFGGTQYDLEGNVTQGYEDIAPADIDDQGKISYPKSGEGRSKTGKDKELEDKVKVIKPDGTLGFIKKDKLEKAIQQGYKEVKE